MALMGTVCTYIPDPIVVPPAPGSIPEPSSGLISPVAIAPTAAPSYLPAPTAAPVSFPPGGNMQSVSSPMADAGVPQFTTQQLPSMTETAQAVTGNQPVTPPALTPQSLVERLPSIIQPAPAIMPTPSCDPLTAWVSQNQLLAALGLGVIAWALFFAGGKE